MRPAYAIAAVAAAVLTVGVQAAAADGFARGDLLASVGTPSVIARFAPDGTAKGTLADSAGAGPLCFDPSGEHLVAPGTGLYDSSGTRLASAWASVTPVGDCTVDKAGNVYLAGGPFTGDRFTGRATIRKFDLTGQQLDSYDVDATGITYVRAVYTPGPRARPVHDLLRPRRRRRGQALRRVREHPAAAVRRHGLLRSAAHSPQRRGGRHVRHLRRSSSARRGPRP